MEGGRSQFSLIFTFNRVKYETRYINKADSPKMKTSSHRAFGCRPAMTSRHSRWLSLFPPTLLHPKKKKKHLKEPYCYSHIFLSVKFITSNKSKRFVFDSFEAKLEINHLGEASPCPDRKWVVFVEQQDKRLALGTPAPKHYCFGLKPAAADAWINKLTRPHSNTQAIQTAIMLHWYSSVIG